MTKFAPLSLEPIMMTLFLVHQFDLEQLCRKNWCIENK